MEDFVAGLESCAVEVDDEEEGGKEFRYTELLHTARMRARKLLQFAKYVLDIKGKCCVVA